MINLIASLILNASWKTPNITMIDDATAIAICPARYGEFDRNTLRCLPANNNRPTSHYFIVNNNNNAD